ncbi:hypothetical protein KYB31_06470 [Clostridium felsineum]|uniref:hypothetical protein n=1 Tax=Clostridium felsineum TaxID=36839 RepID=UPI00214D5436|nr:hypothetical protein [Clostridium felsineum]MCR3758638.1 hypothetical protein [Clostridium felsineum]
MNNDKRKPRMVLNAEAMPKEIYDLLNEKAKSRRLTPYIIELVKKDLSNREIVAKLDMVSNNIDLILSKLNNVHLVQNASHKENEKLKEGNVMSFDEVHGGISLEDLNDQWDF